MASIFAQFKQAQIDGSGAALAEVLIPEPSAQDPNRLRSFYYFTNAANLASDVRYALLQDRATGIKLPKQEGNAWVEVFAAFWKAAREIVHLEEDPQSGSWERLFDAWKDVCSLLLRGYSNGGFQAWTLPCLYVVGKYLRTFAMKADAENAQKPVKEKKEESFRDDELVKERNPKEKLEESSWLLNKMYTTCLHDRYAATGTGQTGVPSKNIRFSLSTGRPLKSPVSGGFMPR